jgi:predicted RNA-binding protein YlqC (UPF0109 family)
MADVRELIEHIVRALVADPSQVQLTESRDDDTIVYTIRAASDELGRVIGKQARVVNDARIALGDGLGTLLGSVSGILLERDTLLPKG